MGAAFDDVVEDQDEVGVANCAQAVSDHETGAAREQHGQRRFHFACHGHGVLDLTRRWRCHHCWCVLKINLAIFRMGTPARPLFNTKAGRAGVPILQNRSGVGASRSAAVTSSSAMAQCPRSVTTSIPSFTVNSGHAPMVGREKVSIEVSQGNFPTQHFADLSENTDGDVLLEK